jgi:hypothetical protein
VIVGRRRVSTTAAAVVLSAIMIVSLVVPAAVSDWLGLAALGVVVWRVVVDGKSPSVIAVGHLGLIVSCFALGVHHDHRAVWLTMLATFTALPLAWAARRGGRPAKGAAGLVTAVVTAGVFAWSTEQLDDEPLSTLRQMLLFGTGAGIVLLIQALRRAKPPPTPPAITEPKPSAKPALPAWARDVTKPGPPTSA